MEIPAKGTASPRSQYEAIEKVSGQVVPELEEYRATEYPLDLHDVWKKFLTLNYRRHWNEGPLPLSFSEIESWKRLTDETLSPLELEIICTLDTIWISEWVKKQPKPKT